MQSFEAFSFYRGVSNSYSSSAVSIITPRRDRQPRDSSVHFHNIADEWFFDRFGFRYRSGGVFVTSRILTATAYASTPAHVVRVLPLSSYSYCWSRNVSDLLFMEKEVGSQSREVIRRHLHMADYQVDELASAHVLGNEVMLNCEVYAAIPTAILPKANGDGPIGSASIILLGN